MILENVDFLKYESSLLVASCIYSAISLLKRSSKYGNEIREEEFREMARNTLIISKTQYKIENLEIVGK